MKLYDYIRNINRGGKNLARNSDADFADFHPWPVNLEFSKHWDTLHFAAIANMFHHMSRRQIYELYKYGTSVSSRRYVKMARPEKNDDLLAVCAAYQCNKNTGRQYLSVLSDTQIKELRRRQDTGG